MNVFEDVRIETFSIRLESQVREQHVGHETEQHSNQSNQVPVAIRLLFHLWKDRVKVQEESVSCENNWDWINNGALLVGFWNYFLSRQIRFEQCFANKDRKHRNDAKEEQNASKLKLFDVSFQNVWH